jgi:hypothetical protein
MSASSGTTLIGYTEGTLTKVYLYDTQQHQQYEITVIGFNIGVSSRLKYVIIRAEKTD